LLPHLIGINDEVAGSVVQVPPPPSFQAPLLPITRAFFRNQAAMPDGRTSAQKSGLRYERKVQVELGRRLGHDFDPKPGLVFYDQREGEHYAFPDGLIKRPGIACIVEIKFQHMPESWWQLRRKYEPIIRWLFPGQKILCLEICSLLDAQMPYPEKFEHVEDILPWVDNAPDGSLGVHQYGL
jgi:hypothetical protein